MERRRLKNGALVPFSLRPKRKYPFPTPIRPGTFLLCTGSPNSTWRKNIGRRFRVGYYSWQDGLDCIWLVNDEGKYEQTIDHKYLAKYFEIMALSKERSLYGKNRPRLGPVT
jgi:hypothetical protein